MKENINRNIHRGKEPEYRLGDGLAARKNNLIRDVSDLPKGDGRSGRQYFNYVQDLEERGIVFPEKHQEWKPQDRDWLAKGVTELSDSKFGLSRDAIAKVLGVPGTKVREMVLDLIEEGKIEKRPIGQRFNPDELESPNEVIQALWDERNGKEKHDIVIVSHKGKDAASVEKPEPQKIDEDNQLLADARDLWVPGSHDVASLAEQLGIHIFEARRLAKRVESETADGDASVA